MGNEHGAGIGIGLYQPSVRSSSGVEIQAEINSWTRTMSSSESFLFWCEFMQINEEDIFSMVLSISSLSLSRDGSKQRVVLIDGKARSASATQQQRFYIQLSEASQYLGQKKTNKAIAASGSGRWE